MAAEKKFQINACYMHKHGKILNWVNITLLALVVVLSACKMTVSLTGGNIDPRAKTVYVQTFTNNSSLVNPTLSQEFTTALKNRI